MSWLDDNAIHIPSECHRGLSNCECKRHRSSSSYITSAPGTLMSPRYSSSLRRRAASLLLILQGNFSVIEYWTSDWPTYQFLIPTRDEYLRERLLGRRLRQESVRLRATELCAKCFTGRPPRLYAQDVIEWTPGGHLVWRILPDGPTVDDRGLW